MTPAPITASRFGIAASSSAPVEVTMVFSSTSTPGSGAGSEPVAMTMYFALWVVAADADLAGRGDRAPALEPVDLVLLEQELDALGVAVDGRLLVGLHLRQSTVGRRAVRPILAKCGVRRVVELGGVQHRLRRDAADVEAGAAEGLAALDAGGPEAELGAADGADVAAGAGPDHDDVVVSHGSPSVQLHGADLQSQECRQRAPGSYASVAGRRRRRSPTARATSRRRRRERRGRAPRGRSRRRRR